MNLTVYIRDREYFHYSGAKKITGVFESEQDIAGFLKENKVSLITIIFSRPSMFVRTLEFPFSSLKKISQVLLEEAAPLFPVSADELEFFWYPVSTDGSKTSVTTFAVEKSKIDKWKKHTFSKKCKIRISFEPFILSNFISRITQYYSFTGIFVDGNYIFRLKVKDNKVVESSSMYLESDVLEIDFSNIIENRTENLPVVYIGDQRFIRDIRGKVINVEKKDFPSILFSLMESYPNIAVTTFKPYSIKTVSVSISPGMVMGIILFLAVSGLMFRPFFIAKKAQIKLDTLNKQMEQVFKTAFPEVTRIVNPLIQARERLRNIGDVQQVIPSISVISIMELISEVVPETIPFKVSQMSLRGTDLFLTCSTNNLENVDLLVRIFKKSKIFQDIKVGGIMPEGGQISFTLLIKVNENAKK
ncbi:MAG: hypothetical protein N2115_06745 [bacterium]|nr:hypothetical protein [bacterium]